MMVKLSSAEADGIGLWRSLVAHLTGGQGVAGSNPVSPTEWKSPGENQFLAGAFPYVATILRDDRTPDDLFRNCMAVIIRGAGTTAGPV